MHPIEQSLSLLKARQFRYGAGFVHPDKRARGVAGTFKRENFVMPGPMPGLVYLRNVGQGNDLMYDQPVAGKGDKMVTEAEAEAYWPSHISQRTFMAPTMRGLGLDADAAAFRMEGGRYAPPDTDFHEQETMDRFTESIAPVMAHETMHGLDSDFSRGSFDQVELPAHILEVATREAQKAREGRFEPEPIIPKASQLLADRPESGQPPNPDYEFDLTSEPIVTGEPMDLAWRLLKEDIDYQDEDYIHPHEQIWNDEADEQLVDTTNSLWDYVESMHPQDKLMMLNQMNNPMLATGINTDPRNRADMTDEETEKYINDAIWEMMFDAWQDSQLEMPDGIDYDLGGNRKSGEPGDPVRAHAVHPSQWKKLAGEPMDIAMRLLKMPSNPL